ncbi:M16 family metallopeptidase [Candidatus Paracaedibacter symbiosus]|uniref:M16 family metallopeptidase n=1 Tax=Candidatus Paracaedibacter symbiosus TaxID=244582 RepID=UPI0005093DC9|nr:pitrilysin family protein [Candidatus Paracaedibacter symbiosus]
MVARLSTLANGLRVATDEIPHVQSCAIGMWVGTGSMYEKAEVNGISHVLEHMAFKGTQTRNAQEIAEVIESVGGYLNAYTSREMTAYHARVLKEDAALAADVLADILQNSLFDPIEFAREQEVIIQEIGQTLDTPDDIIFDYFQDMCYPNQPIGRPILGTEELVRSFTPDLVKNHMRQNYSLENIVFAASGNIKHEEMIALAEAKLTQFTSKVAPEEVTPTFEGSVRIFEKDLEQAHIVFGFEGVPYHHPDYYVSSVYSTLLGGGMSSRLFQEIREKRGLVYTIYSFPTSYLNAGQFSVYAATSENQVKDLLPAMYEELRKVPKTLTMEEVNRAKAQLKAGLMMGAESTMARCEQAARQTLIHGHPIPLTEISKLVENVTFENVIQFSESLLTRKSSLVGHGPIQELVGY